MYDAAINVNNYSTKLQCSTLSMGTLVIAMKNILKIVSFYYRNEDSPWWVEYPTSPNFGKDPPTRN